MKKCPMCGKEYDDSKMFCKKDGMPLIDFNANPDGEKEDNEADLNKSIDDLKDAADKEEEERNKRRDERDKKKEEELKKMLAKMEEKAEEGGYGSLEEDDEEPGYAVFGEDDEEEFLKDDEEIDIDDFLANNDEDASNDVNESDILFISKSEILENPDKYDGKKVSFTSKIISYNEAKDDIVFADTSDITICGTSDVIDTYDVMKALNLNEDVKVIGILFYNEDSNIVSIL